MYPIELNEIYKSYRILIAQDVECLRCYMYVRTNFLEGGVISNFAKLK